ncbi:hypothetical protein, unlikely [Trypanosoma congolense IL3000]|uniref:Uncharacterized protein n=1 Tax=Trypanosoma congolense (strain IL3000) TaxID=1068625 RepID=F9WAZ8_TRYCI|nr:hypothetical protein, unlikely [Trypanosoma congolense IL3000]
MDAVTRSHTFASRQNHRLPTHHMPQPPERFIGAHQPQERRDVAPYAQLCVTLLFGNGASRAQIPHFHFPPPDKANSPRTNITRHIHEESNGRRIKHRLRGSHLTGHRIGSHSEGFDAPPCALLPVPSIHYAFH